MNKIELLQKAQTESVPVLRRVTERFRQLFPELKLQPNALERTPKADTFMTTNLEREYGEIRSITNDFVNTQTQNVETKIQSRLCEGLENPRAYQLQELGQKGEVVSDLDYIEGIQYGKLKNFEYGINGKPIKEIIYDTNGEKNIIISDELGNVLSKERIPKGGMYREKTEFNSDGSQTKTINQKVRLWDKGSEKMIGDAVTKEERNAEGQIVKLTRNETNWGENYESLIEINPKNGRIVRFSLPGRFGTHRDVHLEAEYTPNGFSCKSYKFSRNNGKEVLNVVFDDATGKPIQASGTYVDALRKEKHFLSGEPYSEEEIMNKLHFNPVIYDNDVRFAFIDSQHIDHSLLDYLNAYK